MRRTQDVLPEGIIVQLRACRGRASLQKAELKISTPAPSDEGEYFSAEGPTNDGDLTKRNHRCLGRGAPFQGWFDQESSGSGS